MTVIHTHIGQLGEEIMVNEISVKNGQITHILLLSITGLNIRVQMIFSTRRREKGPTPKIIRLYKRKRTPITT